MCDRLTAETLTNHNEAELQRRCEERQQEIDHMQQVLETKIHILHEFYQEELGRDRLRVQQEMQISQRIPNISAREDEGPPSVPRMMVRAALQLYLCLNGKCRERADSRVVVTLSDVTPQLIKWSDTALLME
ncbi:hypothetical protein E1301_Tti021688 [Triplophysa tibetana]|uniref:Uncharacterized protein n=1 Tax=Triplophysa tibetana TaxID=1572043 RepID=A0A5A9PEH5_9TELE|nr:hypothetical protein E1301_Tti021688 [Triplophysa tibetana]